MKFQISLTYFCVRFHDPENFLKNAVIHYFWFINTVNYGQTPSVSNTPVNNNKYVEHLVIAPSHNSDSIELSFLLTNI